MIYLLTLLIILLASLVVGFIEYSRQMRAKQRRYYWEDL